MHECSVGFDLHVGVAILRVAEGLDYSAILGEADADADSKQLSGSQPPSVSETPPGTPNVGRHSDLSSINDSPLGDKSVTDNSGQRKNKKTKKKFNLV